MFSIVRRITGLSRKYFWRSRKFFIDQNVSCVHFYKMKLGEDFFNAFVKPWKHEKNAFFEQKMNFSEKSFGPIKKWRPESQSKLGSKNTFSLLFWALEPYLRKSPKCSVRLENALQVSVCVLYGCQKKVAWSDLTRMRTSSRRLQVFCFKCKASALSWIEETLHFHSMKHCECLKNSWQTPSHPLFLKTLVGR